jgi:antitoxin component of MazEF toxin-antitoxin module
MIQKVIKIGSSVGVTIPKKHLEEQGIAVGDEVDIQVKPKAAKHTKFLTDLEKFMDTYDQDLKNLAKR